jgi:gamma-glutamyl:cysteine ligase YbdK (ATP-grasp superfamily)
MNTMLVPFGARLMPGGMHPWMDPRTETRLWSHDHAAVYRAYDAIFGCRSHGWANLQSTHVNLPFGNDIEFARLHAALRVIVPILPALSAASPYAEARASGMLDYRMEAYRGNAAAVPEMNGEIVPEVVDTPADYHRRVLEPLYRAIAPRDPDGIMQYEWLNARGAIARFDRSALEIRVMDTQECPRMDVGFAALIIDLAQSLYQREFARPSARGQLSASLLAPVFLRCVHDGDQAKIENADLLRLFGVTRNSCDAGSLWSFIVERLDAENAAHSALWRAPVEFVLNRGPLARRLLRAGGAQPSRAALHELYNALCDALDAGKPFDP